MTCRKCKKEIPDDSVYCLLCGVKQTVQGKAAAHELDHAGARRPRSTFTFEGRRYELTGKTQQDADKKAALMEDRLKRGEVGISSNMTVKRWAGEWLETYKSPKVGEGQYNNYLGMINGHILPEIGSMTVRSVKEVHLQKILGSCSGMSKSYLLMLRRTLKSIFYRAERSGMINSNPGADLELPECSDGSYRSVTGYEREKILSLADTHYAGLWIKAMMYTGIRPGESRALDWRHIDFETRMIHIEQSMKAGTMEIGDPKSDAGVRDIPISNNLYDALLRERRGPFEPVFLQPLGKKRHTKSSMNDMWNNFKRELGISMGAKVVRNQITISAVAADLVPYCLRHTFCTDLQDAGVPINIARYLMGHANIATTAKIYTDTTDKAKQIALKKINAAQAAENKKNAKKSAIL